MSVITKQEFFSFIPNNFYQINIEEDTLSIFVQGIDFSSMYETKYIKYNKKIDLYQILDELDLRKTLTPNCLININISTDKNVNLKINKLKNLNITFEQQNIGSNLCLENIENIFIKTFKKNSLDYFETIKIKKCNNLILWIPNQKKQWKNKLEILNSENINIFETDFSLAEIENSRNIKINNSEIDSLNSINNSDIELFHNNITSFYSYNNRNISFFHNKKSNNIIMLKTVLKDCIIEGKNIIIQNTTSNAIEIKNIPETLSIENLDIDNWLKILLNKTNIGIFLEKVYEEKYSLKNIDILKLRFKNDIEIEISNTNSDEIFGNLSNVLTNFSCNQITKEKLKNEIVNWYIDGIKYIVDNNIYIPDFVKETEKWNLFLKKGRYIINKI